MTPTLPRLVLTARDTGHRLTVLPPPGAAGPCPGDPVSIGIDPRVRYQTIEGFGGAFTEAAATVWQQLPPPARDEVIRAYFDPSNGHGYTLGRTHINSCDFALGNYAYAGIPGDTDLRHFDIARDRHALIPMIRSAQARAGTRLKLLASPWSPPAWMKTNGEMNHGGKLRPEYRDAWARYYARYIEAYASEGLTIWAVSVQNEPAATQRWDSCIYTAEEERDFVRDHLGPTLAGTGHSGVRIVVWDHNRDLLFDRAATVFADPQAARYVWGAAFHWYVNDSFDNVQALHDAYPDKALLFSEGCQEGGPHTGEWGPGERYGRALINDLRRWTVGWIDWNLLLDDQGGPNHVGNYCSAPILANTRTGTLLYQSSYYYLGHFARFVRPGAQRILSTASSDRLEHVAFANAHDGSVVVVCMNGGDSALSAVVRHNGSTASCPLPPHSIATVCFAAP